MTGEKSKFCGYLKSLSDYEPLPWFWDDKSLLKLKGTELSSGCIESEREELLYLYEISIKHLDWNEEQPKVCTMGSLILYIWSE